jgi:hypothetical protein
VSSLNPRVCFVAEYSLLEGYEDSLPEPIRRRLTPDLIRKPGLNRSTIIRAEARPRTDEGGRRYCTGAAVTSTNPRLLLSLAASGVFMAAKMSAALTQTGGYLYRATSRMRKRSALPS